MKTIQKIILLATIAMLAGCASAQQMRLPNGEQGFYVKCSRSKSVCYEEASEVCEGKYKVLDQTDASKLIENNIMGNSSLVHAKRYEMMIQCQ